MADGDLLASLGLIPNPFRARGMNVGLPSGFVTPALSSIIAPPSFTSGQGITTGPDINLGSNGPSWGTEMPTMRSGSVSGPSVPGWTAPPTTQTPNQISEGSYTARVAQQKRLSEQAAPVQNAGVADNSDLWGVIDEVAGDPRIALAMKMAAQMESGGRLDAIGDQGQSHGPFQIYQGAHASRITPEQSRDPRAAATYMRPEFERAVAQVDPNLWQSDPARAAARAAFLAERPQDMYPDERVQQAYSAVAARPRLQGARTGFSSSANEERDQMRSQKSAGAVAANIAAGVRDGSLTPNQFASGLSAADAASACGPAAAVAFARTYGRFPTLQEATKMASTVGWTAQTGMAGPQSQVNLLNKMGIQSKLVQGTDWGDVAGQLMQGKPVILDTPQHYWVAEAYDPQTNKFDFGNSALVLKRSGGRRWLTSTEMMALAGGEPRSSIFLA